MTYKLVHHHKGEETVLGLFNTLESLNAFAETYQGKHKSKFNKSEFLHSGYDDGVTIYSNGKSEFLTILGVK